jgi:hypothetical protein
MYMRYVVEARMTAQTDIDEKMLVFWSVNVMAARAGAGGRRQAASAKAAWSRMLRQMDFLTIGSRVREPADAYSAGCKD